MSGDPKKKPPTATEVMRNTFKDGLWMLPPHMRPGITGYFDRGQNVGGFLTAVLTGDYDQAQRIADGQNLRQWSAWDTFLKKHMPANAHGSREKFDAWRAQQGLRGPERKEREAAS